MPNAKVTPKTNEEEAVIDVDELEVKASPSKAGLGKFVTADDKWGQALHIITQKPMFIGQKYVPVIIPKDKLSGTTYYKGSINGQDFKIGYGEVYMVPQSVADNIASSMEAERKADENMKKLRNVEVNWG